MSQDDRHLPGRYRIDAYGGGGFRFADLSHRGSLLCLPSGMRAWGPTDPSQLDEAAFARALGEAGEIDTLLVGTGPDIAPLKKPLRETLKASGIVAEAMATGAAVRTWNVLLAEGRRVAAALIAVS
ncbi:Mth938-like domain-containing protein [Hansschlegelia quercus]|uniref:Mth938-like domain-containing protein n=1 Tax=Hansschlegelia quercus TaxID=2528245 RepID=A0A4Q9GJD2_9HYPH|nr:MTH938/NDUFAF3 family protein [Hansschlegelia quercus]TBN54353.1 hypothetical protein EYR15_05835 [Hansschlegelia quercus]